MTSVEVSTPRNLTKARIRAETRGGCRVVVKDFSDRPRGVRLFLGRPTLRREARAYARLSGLDGIPRCFGLETPDRLALEWIDGRPLGALRDASLQRETFERAAAILRSVHDRGVAIADLHASNVLVTADERVFLVDFAQARIAVQAGRPGPLVRSLMRLDLHALERIRARHYGEPEPEARGSFGVAYRMARRIKKRLPSLD